MFIEFHRTLISDRRRNEAFYEALKRVIKPGVTTVADLGSGSGLLGFYAARLGAKDVYLYEYSPALKLSRKIARANNLRRCHFVHAHSHDVRNPVKVDVVVSETLGNYAYEENIVENLGDAQRFLKPGGVMIPQQVAQYVAPVVSSWIHDELSVWDNAGANLDFAFAKEMSFNNMYVRTLAAKDLLDGGASAKRWDNVDLCAKKNASLRHGEAKWKLGKDAMIYGFALWWDCQLLPDISISTSPLTPRSHWEQLYCPIPKPLQARAGDEVSIALTSDSRYKVGASLKWEVALRNTMSGKTSRQILDTKNGDIA